MAAHLVRFNLTKIKNQKMIYTDQRKLNKSVLEKILKIRLNANQ